MSRATINPRYHRQVEREPRFRAAMHAEAVRGGKAVKAKALTFRQTGAFARSLQVDGNRIESTDPFAHLIEFGSRQNPAYAPLRRGIRAAGFEARDIPK